MSEEKKQDESPKKKTLGLKGGTLSLKGGAAAKTAPSGGGTVVEVRRKRSAGRGAVQTPDHAAPTTPLAKEQSELEKLTSEEREARAKALKEALANDGVSDSALPPPPTKGLSKVEQQKEENIQDARARELAELERIEAEEKARAAAADAENQQRFRQQQTTAPALKQAEERDKLKKPTRTPRTSERRRGGKITVTQVLNNEYDRDRGMSLAAQKRAREKARLASQGPKEPAQKVYREVTIPETITVQELANRMTERGADVIKTLMGLGVMATINQIIDADTAELVVEEFGHKIKRVTEADVEEGLEGIEDKAEDLKPRPPVVTIMGHVDHGKTSLLDALRQTDVVAGEAGGITQHIGAYQIEVESGDKVTFLDTPGHAAFTEMRARGANVTDIVVLVVSAADSIMPQTIEAINHAKAAEVPIIVAVNKIDLPDAEPYKVKQDLLQHEVIPEDMGGDVQCIEVSAIQKTNLDKLVEAILLQAELLELKANPDRDAQGAVVEAKMEPGRGSVATILVQNGTLKVGDTFVVGSETGRVRALINDKGEQIQEAIPGLPVEVLGLNGTPDAGDILNVADESKAREIAQYRQRQKRDIQAVAAASGRTMESMLAAAKEGEKQTLSVVIKGDVHGSVEAIIGSLNKLTEDNDELAIQVLHSGVGGITESDVTLAGASNALLIGFNVRANAQAREQAQRDALNIRYYNVIYDVIDDAKAILGGMLAPEEREEYLGHAEIREVFHISKYGNIAGCMVTTGMVKRGAKVRLLRDDVVIHEGTLKTLKRFKDEVKEVKEGMECGMAFENYDDIKEKDVIECYEIVEEARTLE
ncbi:MAG: translation initiation factor IF-2 [Alphaproteobacteria bacterium]|nr:translation initiation factor IF-2 [Alphaproteobacteria bacterium]